jgi:hypothetical protein
MIETTIIDFLAMRLPVGADSYPDWTIRCTWVRPEDGEEVGHTFHRCTNVHTARNLATFILDRYSNIDVHKLSRTDVLHPDGTWENVQRRNTTYTPPVMCTFQRLPDRPLPRGAQAQGL